jgi:hypothetical protein
MRFRDNQRLHNLRERVHEELLRPLLHRVSAGTAKGLHRARKRAGPQGAPRCARMLPAPDCVCEGVDVGTLYAPAVRKRPMAPSPSLTLSVCRVDNFVAQMWTSAPEKKCNQTAEGLAALPAAWSKAQSTGNTDVLEDVIAKVHNSNCLAGIMSNWASRDIHCRDNPLDQTQSRMMMILLQYYNSFHENVEMPSPVHRRELENAGMRRAEGTTKIPNPKSFCLVQLADFLKRGGNLFDKTKCGGKHPIWSDMGPGTKTCTADCWTHMKAEMKDGGCVALYYETMFDLVNVGRTADAGAGTNTIVTVKSLVDKMDSITIDPKCTEGEGRAPCTAINDAIAACAENNGQAEYVKWTPMAEKVDPFGATTKGGVKCWQGTNCH